MKQILIKMSVVYQNGKRILLCENGGGTINTLTTYAGEINGSSRNAIMVIEDECTDVDLQRIGQRLKQ